MIFIEKINGRDMLNSRGNLTVEADVWLNKGRRDRAAKFAGEKSFGLY